jgi:hypothetical protein
VKEQLVLGIRPNELVKEYPAETEESMILKLREEDEDAVRCHFQTQSLLRVLMYHPKRLDSVLDNYDADIVLACKTILEDRLARLD